MITVLEPVSMFSLYVECKSHRVCASQSAPVFPTHIMQMENIDRHLIFWATVLSKKYERLEYL